ncbi:hypothetical protein H6G52_02250 [Limnothrix sp. FACHB-881]|uniref:hypothetical protein n=1 Tax=Limnothrix sp. FACHB-881 TaxID=2692819 RepID=UPI001683D090|nr:hypothetical protein [Limnothrix sp. FACHB-881]MBD2634172.1 hypothetical protein [Limnothrix sp. FACHB-881]
MAKNVLGFLAPSWIQFSINLWVVPWIGSNPRPGPEAPDRGFEEAQQFYSLLRFSVFAICFEHLFLPFVLSIYSRLD